MYKLGRCNEQPPLPPPCKGGEWFRRLLAAPSFGNLQAGSYKGGEGYRRLLVVLFLNKLKAVSYTKWEELDCLSLEILGNYIILHCSKETTFIISPFSKGYTLNIPPLTKGRSGGVL